MEKRLAAILISDIVGYTKLMEEDTEGTVMAWSDARDNVVEPQVEAANGRLVKFMGDGFLAEFNTIQTALECAIGIQNGVKTNSLKFRMGVHLGDIIDDGKDIYGEGINIASRLEGIAEPGGICISGDVFNQVQNRVHAEYEDLGPQEIKNVAKPVQAFAVRFEKLKLSSEKNGSPPTAKKASLAVLPLDNMSDDPQQGTFCDGITEDLITSLSRIKFLDVIARNSTFAYKRTSPDVRKVALELDARYVIEGSVRKAGDKIRLNVQLLDGSNGAHIWAQKYDGDIIDIFALQDDFVEKVSREIPGCLQEAESARALRIQREKMGPWDACFRALWHYNRQQADDFSEAIEWAELAIDMDPSMGLPWAIKAASYSNMQGLLFNSEQQELVEMGRQGVALAPKDPLARALMGHTYLSAGNISGAQSEYETALSLNPLLHVAWFGLGWIQVWEIHSHQEGREAILESIALDPNGPLTGRKYVALAGSYLGENKIEQAKENIEKAFLSNVSWPASIIKASVYAQLGNLNEGQSILEHMAQNHPDLTTNKFVNIYKNPGPAVENVVKGLEMLNFPSE